MKHLTSRKSLIRRTVSVIAGFTLMLGAVVVPAVSASAVTTAVNVLVQNSSNQPIANTPVTTCNTTIWPEACTSVNTDSQGLATIQAQVNNSGSAELRFGGSQTGYSATTLSRPVVNGAVQYSSTTPEVVTLAPTVWATVSVTVKNSATQQPIQGQQVSFNGSNSYASAVSNSSGVASVPFDTQNGSITSVAASISQANYNAATVNIPISNNSGTAELLTTATSFNLSGSVSFGQTPVVSKTFSYTIWSGNTSTCHDIAIDSSGNYSLTNVGSTQINLYSNPCNTYSAYEYDTLQQFIYDSNEGNNQVHNIVLTQTGVTLTVTESGSANPVKNLRVSLTPVGQNGYSTTATTDSNGIAKFVGLTPGAVYKAAYVRDQYDSSLRRFEEKTNTSTVTVGNANTMVTDALVLSRLSTAPVTPVTISGRIVTGVNSTPVVGAAVRAYWNRQINGSNESYELTVYTDSQGNYSLTDFPYGQTSLNITASGYRSVNNYFSTSSAQGTSYPQGNLNLRPTPLGNLTYSGVLRDSSQNPISGMRLYLYSTGGSGQPSTVTTNGSGAFSFTNLIQGMYFLSADVWASDSIYEPISWPNNSVDLTSSQTNVQISLSPRTVGNASAAGRVAEYLDVSGEGSATPLAGLNVYLWPKNGGQGFSATTNASGEWSITGLSNNQEYQVSVQYNYQSYEWPQQNNIVVAKNSGGTAHQLLLKRISAGTGSLTGRVKDSADYSNLSGIQVSLYRSFGGVNIAPVTTDTRGEYSFSNLPTGEYYMIIGDQNQNYRDAFMSVEIGTSGNRINALLTEIPINSGSITGTVLDDRGIPLAGAYVEVWNTNDSSLGGFAQTNSEGRYAVENLPSGLSLNFRVMPAWDLRYEVSSYLTSVTLSTSAPTDVIDVQLEPAAFITGTVSGIPASGNVPPVAVELIDSSSGTVMNVASVRADNGVYTFASVPAGNYIIRFTQRANYQGYSGGGWGFASGGSDSETISLRPVYWDGTTNGTSDRTQAGTVTLAAGGRVAGKSVSMTPGSSISGTVFIETPDGTSRLTGTRSVLVYIYQKQSNGSWEQVGYPEGVNGYTNSEIKIAGLGAGRYKLKFEDSRRGNNSLSTVFNGGASSLAQAPEIVVTDGATTTVTQTLSVAPPERSAEAFDLDDLGQQLSGLENQIAVSSELSIGSEESVYVGIEFAGEYVSAFANSTPTTLGSWKQVDSDGYIKVVIPADLEQGSHRIAVQDANLKVIGWTAVTIVGSSTEAGVLKYSPRKTVVSSEDSAVSTSTKPIVKKSQNSEETSIEAAVQDSTDTTNNIWLMFVLGAALLVGIAGAIWLIRSRKS